MKEELTPQQLAAKRSAAAHKAWATRRKAAETIKRLIHTDVWCEYQWMTYVIFSYCPETGEYNLLDADPREGKEVANAIWVKQEDLLPWIPKELLENTNAKS